MKWLLVLLVVLGGLWWLRQSRRGRETTGQTPSTKSSAASPPQAMTRCLHCGVHLPLNDATHGTQGAYCSPAHRQQHEQ